jgi:hypothetical protein
MSVRRAITGVTKSVYFEMKGSRMQIVFMCGQSSGSATSSYASRY